MDKSILLMVILFLGVFSIIKIIMLVVVTYILKPTVDEDNKDTRSGEKEEKQ